MNCCQGYKFSPKPYREYGTDEKSSWLRVLSAHSCVLNLANPSMAFGGCGGIGCQINTWGGTCDCLLCAWLTCTSHADCTPGTAEMKEWSFWHCTTCVTDINDCSGDSHQNVSKWTLILFKRLKPDFALFRVLFYIKIGCWYMYMSNLIHKWIFTCTTYFK